MNDAERISNAIRRLRFCEFGPRYRKESPSFLFLCGGDDTNPKYICRDHIENYIKTHSQLNHILTVKPEILLNNYSSIIDEINLLELEAVIADLSDAILLFDESPGSLCELGAFAMSSAIREIMTVCIPKKHRYDKSFIIQGPIRQIEQNRTELSSVIYLDTNCPFTSVELVDYFDSLELHVKKSKSRKINYDAKSVNFGAFCRECLDLISVFAPLTDKQLLDIYKEYKRFNTFAFQISTLDYLPRSLSYRVALAYLASTGLISYDLETNLINMAGEVPGYFLFSTSKRIDVQVIRAELLSYRHNIL